MQTETALRQKYLIPSIYNPEEWKDVILDKKVYTYNDYKKLPEGAPYQLIGGSLIMTPAPEVYHQEVSGNIQYRIQDFVIKNDLGHVYYSPIDVMFSKTEVYQPDIIFIKKSNKKIIGRKKINGAPDLVVEILSPSTAYFDLREKYRVYEKSGVKEYWIVDPKLKKIEIFENKKKKFYLNNESEKKGRVSSIVLKGLYISLKDIF